MDFISQIVLDPDSPTPLAVQLSEQLLSLIASGLIRQGEQLPPVRSLADQVGIHMHTVRASYHLLEEKGVVSIAPGRGTIVNRIDLARLLAKSHITPSFSIAVIQPGFNPFYDAFHQGIEDEAKDSPSLLFVCNSHDSPARASAYLKQVIARGVDGIIVISTDFESDPSILAYLEQANPSPPLVSVDIPTARRPDVLFDVIDGAYSATRHLLQHSPDHVALITPPVEWPNLHSLYQGYRKALGDSFDPELVITIDSFTVEEGARGAMVLLEGATRPRAILAADDSIAIGAMRAIHAHGLRIPEDIALIGFNDIAAAAVVTPSLTTVRLPAYDMGKLAMRRLKACMAGEDIGTETVILPVELVIRQSCGC